MASDKIRLSPSTINLFCDCPRCFYLQVKLKLGRPRGIFPSLPGGIDKVLKANSEQFREAGKLPPNLEGQIHGKLAKEMPKQMKYYDEKLDADLRGNMDELLEMDDGTFVTLDFKTRGYPPKGNIPAYQNQMDIYTYLLNKNGYKTKEKAYLAYFYPIDNDGNRFNFELELKEMTTSMSNAEDLFRKAVETLRSDEIPPSSPQCEYCKFESKRRELE